MRINFVVFGIAQTAGSKRSMVPLDRHKEPFRRPGGGIIVSTVDDNPKTKSWQAQVAYAAHQAFNGGELLRGALRVQMIFYRPRPKSHLGKTGLTKLGREHPYPSVKPDVLKLARAAEDSLTGVLYSDDALIVDEHLLKLWGEPARLEVEIHTL
jgi:Holliday junction resolvase RusA-like endonuclease